MKNYDKGLFYVSMEHLRLTLVLEEKLIKMLEDKWTHKWSTGYPDDDYDIIHDVATDIRQVLHDNILKEFIKHE